VFDAATDNKRELLNQIWKFYSGRIVTLIIEEVILFVFISWLGMNSIFIKIIAQIVVIVLNYVISKLFVFTKEEKE
jgi:putative flippase GtrA